MQIVIMNSEPMIEYTNQDEITSSIYPTLEEFETPFDEEEEEEEEEEVKENIESSDNDSNNLFQFGNLIFGMLLIGGCIIYFKLKK